MYLRKGNSCAKGNSMCLRDEETVNHLMIPCPFAHRVRIFFLNMFEIQWVMPGIVVDLFYQQRLGGN